MGPQVNPLALVRLVHALAGTRALAGLVALSLGTAAVEAAALLLLLPVVAALAGTPARLPLLGPVPTATAVALLGVAVVLRAVLQWVSAVVTTRIRLVAMDRLRLDALRALFGAAWSHVTSHRRSHVVQSLTAEVLRAGTAVDLLGRVVVGVVLLVAAAVVLLVVSPGVGLVALAAVAALGLVALPSMRGATALGEAFGQRVHAFGALVTDSLAALRLIRAHDAADRWLGLVAEEAAAGREVQLRYASRTALVRSLLGALAVVVALGVVLLGHAWGVGPAALVVLAAATLRLLTTAQSLVGQAQQLQHLAPALARVRSLTTEALARPEAPRPEAPRPEAPRPDGPPGSLVELRDVSVTHEDAGSPALAAVSLAVPRDGLVVVTGPSGAGKSTLLDVVLGLLRPTTGEVLVDGTPLADVRRWRARVGYVPQETVLLPGSVRDNLTWSLPSRDESGATDERLWAALAQAELEPVVRALPDGLDTELRDFTRLSGGEQQRLCLARALVRDPDLLVLDEATSALDVDTETRVLAALRRRRGAVLMVSHRPDAPAAADVHLALV